MENGCKMTKTMTRPHPIGSQDTKTNKRNWMRRIWYTTRPSISMMHKMMELKNINFMGSFSSFDCRLKSMCLAVWKRYSTVLKSIVHLRTDAMRFSIADIDTVCSKCDDKMEQTKWICIGVYRAILVYFVTFDRCRAFSAIVSKNNNCEIWSLWFNLCKIDRNQTIYYIQIRLNRKEQTFEFEKSNFLCCNAVFNFHLRCWCSFSLEASRVYTVNVDWCKTGRLNFFKFQI